MPTLDEQIKCVGRELGMRRNVYPKFILSKRMTEEKAAHEIHCMEAVYETLKRLKTEQPPPKEQHENQASTSNSERNPRG